MCNMFNIYEYASNYQMGFVFDQFQTSKPFRGAGFIITCLCKRCSKCERKKMGMLKIENYKNKSNRKINEKQ